MNRVQAGREVTSPAVCVAGILAVALFMGVAVAQRPTQTRTQEVPKPADPAAIKGRWTVGGEPRTITAGDFYRVHTILAKLEGSARLGVPEQRVWEFLLLQDEARAFGLEVTAEEVDAALKKDDPDLYEGVVSRWAALGVSAEDGRDYTRGLALIRKLKDLFVNTIRVTTRDAFDDFKQKRLQFKLAYLEFAAEDYTSEFPADKIDEATLRQFWSENKLVQNQFRTPHTLSVEFVYLDPNSLSLEDAEKLVGGRTVDRDAALDYFWKHKDTLVRQVPPDKQHLLSLEGKDLDEIVTPFSILEETIKKKLLLQGIIDKAHSEALDDEQDVDLAALAQRYGLGYERFDEIDRPTAIMQLRRYGLNTFNTLNAAPVDTICPTIQEQQGTLYFFRLNAKTVSRLPEFEEIADALRERYIQENAAKRAREEAQKLVTYMNERVQADLAPLQAELEKQADEEAMRRVQELGLSNPQDVNREKLRARSQMRQRLEEKKRSLMPKYFDAWVSEHGLELHETPYFEFEPFRPDRRDVTDPEKSRVVFLRSNYYVRSLEPGQVTPILLEDPTTHAFFVAKLIDRKDPDIRSMGPVDLTQAKKKVMQRFENMTLHRFRYPAVSQRMKLELERN